MRYILVFVSVSVFMYLMTAFINLSLDVTQWYVVSRIVFTMIVPVIGVFAVMLFRFAEKDEQEVIIRDKKTGRFKKK